MTPPLETQLEWWRAWFWTRPAALRLGVFVVGSVLMLPLHLIGVTINYARWKASGARRVYAGQQLIM